MKNNFIKWLKCATIQAIKTMAQSALGIIASDILISDINYKILISTVIISGITSFLTSTAGLPETEMI